MAKRGQGEGTISKRSDGTWWARITVGRTPEGKQKRKAFYGKTRKEVQEKLTAALNDINNHVYIEPSKMTIEQWIEIWLNDYKKNSLKPTTYINYQRFYKNYISPIIGKYQLKDLRNVHIQQIINTMVDRGLRSSTIEFLYIIISSALKQAVKNNMIGKNVAENVILPKCIRAEKRALTPEEQDKFIEVAKSDCHGEFYILALATGMRHGELLALTWDDIDFNNAVLSINKTLYMNKDMDSENVKWKFEVGTPKTESSKRIIPLLPSIVTMLKDLKKKQELIKGETDATRYSKAYKGSLQRRYVDNNLVFCTFEGKPLRQSDMRQRFVKLLGEAGIVETGLNIHSLRHTFATRGLENGIELKVMQELLGHSSIKMTADLYTHVLPSKKKNSILKLEQTIKL